MEKKMKVIEVKIENFKNIENLDMSPGGKSVLLVGGNRVGKTSVIQAIWGTLSQKAMPETPLTKGKTTGSVIVVMGNDNEKYIVKRIISDSGASLEIQNADGFKTTQVKVLRELVGDIDFDIEHFVELSKTIPGKREQIEIVKSMLEPDVRASLSKLEYNKKMATETKSENNILLKDRMGLIKSIKDLPMEETPIVTQTVINEINKQKEFERQRLNIVGSIKNLYRLAAEAEMSIQRAMKTVAECKKQEKGLEAELKNLPEPKDTNELEKQLRDAEEHNKHFERYQTYTTAMKDAEEYNQKVYDCNQSIQEDDRKIREIVANSDFPVKDLTITEDGLLYKGLPFDNTVLSTSELLEVGVKLAVSRNPNVKIIRIPQAESLDKESMVRLMKFTDKAGYQLFIEKVTEDEKLIVRIIENGRNSRIVVTKKQTKKP
jgi:predicted ATP-dependent endonuclease of OLD family